jgi:hypothetical protein
MQPVGLRFGNGSKGRWGDGRLGRWGVGEMREMREIREMREKKRLAISYYPLPIIHFNEL